MAKFRKKPVVIEAVQWCGEYYDCEDMPEWLINAIEGGVVSEPSEHDTPVIRTLEGDMLVSSGDWVIQGVKGEVYPCKPDIFAATYEPA